MRDSEGIIKRLIGKIEYQERHKKEYPDEFDKYEEGRYENHEAIKEYCKKYIKGYKEGVPGRIQKGYWYEESLNGRPWLRRETGSFQYEDKTENTLSAYEKGKEAGDHDGREDGGDLYYAEMDRCRTFMD